MTTEIARRRAYTIGWVAPAAFLTALSSAVAAAPTASAEDHTVVDGDTLFDIAQRFGVPVSEIRQNNSISADAIIRPGDVIRVPTHGSTSPDPGPEAAQPGPDTTYEVIPGDTLWSIAQNHGIGLDALYAINGIGSDSIIYPGQVLRFSASAPSPAAAAPTPLSTMAPDEEPSDEPAPSLASPTNLDSDQADNAALIIDVGRELGISERGITIALGTAMVESNLRNLPTGDRDSIGLFQQRTSTGWGDPEQIADPVRSTRAFFLGVTGPEGPTALGLLDVTGWESMPFTAAAQAVQLSAYPLRYGAWEEQAEEWLATHG